MGRAMSFNVACHGLVLLGHFEKLFINTGVGQFCMLEVLSSIEISHWHGNCVARFKIDIVLLKAQFHEFIFFGYV
jgi:hypothetical protein